MRYNRILTIASFASLMTASAPLCAGAAMLDQTVLKSRAEAELTTVTAEVDLANILFSPVDDCDEPIYAKVIQYHREYMAGLQDFQDRKYDDALQHLHKADEVIRSRPNWTEFQTTEDGEAAQ
jgi:hypothetical protein